MKDEKQYDIPDALYGHKPYATMLEALEDNRIMGVIMPESGGCVVSEHCDYYFSLSITKDQLRALGEELIALADK